MRVAIRPDSIKALSTLRIIETRRALRSGPRNYSDRLMAELNYELEARLRNVVGRKS